jgi:tRNA-splicing ligase RtcB
MQAKQIRPGVWEFQDQGAKVPVRIYATENLFRKMEEGVFKQAANVAQLPGIQKASLVMPDGHYGYGFPIGGVAAFDLEEGIVSPGGVGYDINCLPGDARILHEHGYTRPVREFEKIFENERIKCMNFTRELKSTEIELFIESKLRDRVYRIKTRGGRELTATGDHPLYTPRGMVPLREASGRIAVYSFQGVPYEKPCNEVIVSERDVLKLQLKKNKKQSIDELKKRDLLPLRYDNEKLPYLLKIIGFVLGDGALYSTGNKGTVWFYGEPRDLELIRGDMKKLGFNPSRVYSRTRDHEISTEYDDVKFTRTEYSFKTTSSSLAALLFAMGVPHGVKAAQDYEVPAWLSKCTLWQKRLFLAALFGAELSTPSTVTKHGYNFYTPVLSMNKKKESLRSGRRFIGQLCKLLREFGVSASPIRERKEIINKKGDMSYRLRLQVSSKPENLIIFWSSLGFEFNEKKRFRSNIAIQYLRLKDNVITERISADRHVKEMKKKSVPVATIYDKFRSKHVNKRFIERSLYEERNTKPRIPSNFPTFEEFLENVTRGLGTTGMVWDEILSKEIIKYNGHVYDFTVRDEHHNFIADNFVVSNCGVRLLATNLTENDIRPRLKAVVDSLFTNIPSGVGSKSKLRISERELDQVSLKGAGWAVEQGLGYEKDLEHMEENGCIKGANPQDVSKRAKDRGRPQLGTLGAGNHFLEVQKVDKIYDKGVAEKFGITSEDQITVMVHTGSRGFGHQIADEYINVMLSAAHRYGIDLPDKELACAPIDSPEARRYLSAMRCGVNYAFCNREIITYWVRESFRNIFRDDCDIQLIYDVCHNIAKFEKHNVDGETKELCIHRKGATRAFASGRAEIPKAYRDVGQPVIIPGDMGTASYVLVGTERAMEETWGSTCHGAGRVMSRHGAIRKFSGTEIQRKLEAKGQVVRATHPKVLAEEASEAYKDIDEVVKSVDLSGISRPIARVVPLGVAKG